MDLFATSENAHCPLFFAPSHSPLKVAVETSRWPAARLYAFPPINILPLVLCTIRKEGASVIVTAPNWPNHPWSLDLTELLVAPPCPIPISKDLLSQVSVAPEPGVVVSSCLAASGIPEELSALHSHVLDVLSEVRTPSTRRLYALKWRVFV